MASSDWGAIVVAIIGLAGVVFQARRPRLSLRDKIKADLDLLSSLPDNSSAKAELLVDIEQNVKRLVAGEEQPGADGAGIMLGLLITGAFTWLTWWADDMGGTYLILWIVSIPAALAGILLILRSWRVVYRYDDGRPVLGPDGRATHPPGYDRFGSLRRGVDRMLDSALGDDTPIAPAPGATPPAGPAAPASA